MTIYFIRAVDCGRIKIGYTADQEPSSRVNGIQTSCPSELEVLAYCEGSESRERELHRLFGESRVRGEWFTPSKQLASLVHFAKLHSTTDGWERAEVGTEEWADMLARFALVRRPRVMSEPDADIKVRWAVSLDREYYEELRRARSRERAAVLWDSVDLHEFWSVERGETLDQVAHLLQESEHKRTEFVWVTGAGESHWSSKAAVQTVEMLNRARTREDVAAVWIGACMHALTNRKQGNRELAVERFPRLPELEDACRNRVSGWWPELGVHALPLQFTLPKRCVLSLDEFVFAAARHMRATLQCYRPTVLWEHGAACWLSEPHFQAVA